MKETYYKLKVKTDEDFKTEKEFEKYIETFTNELSELGWMNLPLELYGIRNDDVLNALNRDVVIYTIAKQDEKSDLVNFLFNLYNDPKWQKEHLYGDDDRLSKDKLKIYRDIGIIFIPKLNHGTLKYEVKRTKEVRKMFSMWRLECNLSTKEKMLGLTISDTILPTFIGTEILDKYCEKQIKALKEKGLIEEIDINKNGVNYVEYSK